MKKVSLFSLVLIGSLLGACSKIDKSKEDLILYNTLDMESRVLNYESTMKEGGAHGGKYYSSVDSVQRFAIGYSYVIPDSLKSRTLTVYVNAWLRETVAPLQGGIAFSLSNSKGNMVWHETTPKKDFVYKPNEWVHFQDSMIFKASMLNDTYTEIGIVGIKTYGADRLDIDDFQVKYKFSK